MHARRITLASAIIASLILVAVPAHAQLANAKCKFLGNVIPGSTPSGFSAYWNQVTPENAGKWGSVEGERGVMTWDALDNAYGYAHDNNFPFKQHTLVWGQQQPAWLDGLSAQEQKEEVEEWIEAFCTRYPDTEYIDVVNEPLHAVPGYSEALGGAGTTGWDWVVWAFGKAREYCPHAKLVLNDYSILSSDAATTDYLTIINILKEKSLIDIVGEQGHFLETTPLATIKKNLDRLEAAGLPIHISEYDVNLENDNDQRTKYEEQFPVLWEHPAVHGITLWGYRQGAIWREHAYLLRSNGSARPAMTWLTDYVRENPGGTFCNPVTGMLEADTATEIYPLPVREGRFTLSAGINPAIVRIFDLRGNMKLTLQASDDTPRVVEFHEPAGLYLMQISSGNSTTWKKILVN